MSSAFGYDAGPGLVAVEIERKFLVTDSSWRGDADRGRLLRQGYLTSTDNVSVRVRITDDARATLTVKLPKSGVSRYEFEQDIALHEADSLIGLCGEQVISKIRYEIVHAGHVWEIDDYKGRNEGLVVSEIELRREGEEFVPPRWLGNEISGVARYQNSALVKHPFQSWPEQLPLQWTA